MKIVEGPYHNTKRGNVHVWVEYNGEKVLVGISSEALEDDYDVEHQALLEGFVKNQEGILGKIEYLLASAPETPEGEPRVLIRTGQ